MRRRQSCRGCIYQTSWFYDHKGCGYLFATGKQRGCPADKCDKKLTRSQIHAMTIVGELKERRHPQKWIKIREFTGINSELKTLIQKANLTQKKVAKMMNMPYNTFTRKISHGSACNNTYTMHFSGDEKQRIADIFGISADVIE